MHMFKRIFIIITTLCVILIPNRLVEANEHKMESLSIHTYIHEDGSATITETRQVILNEGTENYDIIENLGKSKIKDFTVSENGKTYEFIDKWNIDAFREEKSFKNGIIKTDNGYELVWGIGKYGPHKYTLTYTVTDFVKQLQDSQILFWRYVNDETNIPPEKLTIKIETEKNLNKEDEKIWGFGFDGNIFFKDGDVTAISHSPLTSNDYATILIKFSDNQFKTSDVLHKTFEEIKNEAFIGSDYKDGESSQVVPAEKEPIWLYIFIPLIVLSPLIIFGFVILYFIYRAYRQRKRINKFKGEYERDIPYDGPPIDLYQFLTDLKITKFENIIAAFLLKWIDKEYIHIEEEEEGFLFKVKTPIIYIHYREELQNELESELYQMLIDAAGKDNKLRKTMLTKWFEKNRSVIRSWETKMKQSSITTLTDQNIFKEKEKRFLLFFKRHTHEMTEKGYELEGDIVKFSNYLRDYSLLNEHEPINVKLWDNLMIWAAVLGITDEVYKQFQKLYPTYLDESSYSSVSISATSSFSRSISNAKSYVSSGGGGSVSGGGGGGSFGGGSGGGTR